jgi:hypothetical protein
MSGRRAKVLRIEQQTITGKNNEQIIRQNCKSTLIRATSLIEIETVIKMIVIPVGMET